MLFGGTRKRNAENKEIAGLCKGSTADSDSVCEGSNPSPAAKARVSYDARAFSLFSSNGKEKGVCDDG